jgi:hypothetical protein
VVERKEIRRRVKNNRAHAIRKCKYTLGVDKQGTNSFVR